MNPHTEDLIAGTILLVICLGAIIGNTSMWIIIYQNKALRNVTNSFILGLSTADLLVSVCNMPITVATLYIGRWPLSDTFCRFCGFTNMLTMVTSGMSLCNISINRFVRVCKPLYFKRIYTRRNAALMLAGTVVVSALLSLPPLDGWAEYSYIEIQSFCFCDWTKSLSYTIFMIGMCFGIPFSIMTVCNINIFRTIRSSNREIQPTSGDVEETNFRTSENPRDSPTKDKKGKETKILSVSYASSSKEKMSNLEDTANETTKSDLKFKTALSITQMLSKVRAKSVKSRSEEIRVSLMLAVVILMFVICWMPFNVSLILSLFAPDKAPHGFHLAALLIAYANSGINPIIYGIMNENFRDAFKKLFCCRYKK